MLKTSPNSKIKTTHFQERLALTNLAKVNNNLPPILQIPFRASPNRDQEFNSSHKKKTDKLQVTINVQNINTHSVSCVTNIDQTNHCISLSDLSNSNTTNNEAGVHQTKTFQVDSIIHDDMSLVESCSGILCDAIRTVASGVDYNIISFGVNNKHERTLPVQMLLGDSQSNQQLGLIPLAIQWLYRFMRSQHTNTSTPSSSLPLPSSASTASQYTIRCSALSCGDTIPSLIPPHATYPVEIYRDLLKNLSLTNAPLCNNTGYMEHHPSELRASNEEKAGLYLDNALSQLSSGSDRHFVFTLHLYQYYSQNTSTICPFINGGHSKLQIININCPNQFKPQFTKWLLSTYCPMSPGDLQLPDANSSSDLPIGKLLNCSQSSNTPTHLIFQLSAKQKYHNSSLQIAQLSSKIYRYKIRSLKSHKGLEVDQCNNRNSFSQRRSINRRDSTVKSRGSTSTEDSTSNSSCQERCSFNLKLSSRKLHHSAERSLGVNSDFDMTSNSEISCDTVIYRGSRQLAAHANSPLELGNIMRGWNGNAEANDDLGDCNTKRGGAHLSEAKIDGKSTEQISRRRGSDACAQRSSRKKPAWPKTALKRAGEVMKCGQELWVDGPEAFYSIEELNCRLNQSNSRNIENKPKNCSTHHKNGPIVTKQKTEFVHDWLNKQPYISLTTDADMFTSSNKLNHKPDDQKHREQNLRPYLDYIGSDRIQAFDRIEEWIKSVTLDNPKSPEASNNPDVIMTQSLYSPSATPLHSSHLNNKSISIEPSSIKIQSTPLKIKDPSASFFNDSRCPQKSKRSINKQMGTPLNNRFSTLPLDSYSPRHKSKEVKKKDTSKKPFSFFNHFIRAKKLKKEVINETNIIIGSPYRFISPSESKNVETVCSNNSSGRGSDCSSFKKPEGMPIQRREISKVIGNEESNKVPERSITDTSQNGGFKYLLNRRAGSSGYESVVRDSEELSSSHNDSTSDTSIPPNQIKTMCARITQQTSPLPANSEEKTPSHHNHNNREIQQVQQMIELEKYTLLRTEREDLKNELLHVLSYFNNDSDTTKHELTKQLDQLESSYYSPNQQRQSDLTQEMLLSTNSTLKSVLNRYQSNLCLVTTFLGHPTSKSTTSSTELNST